MMPEIRKDILLVTKDHPNTPRHLIRQLDMRLTTLKVDEVGLFLIHAIGNRYGKDHAPLEWLISMDGDRDEARPLFAALPDSEREGLGADLEAARRSCPNRLDFARSRPTSNATWRDPG